MDLKAESDHIADLMFAFRDCISPVGRAADDGLISEINRSVYFDPYDSVAPIVRCHMQLLRGG